MQLRHIFPGPRSVRVFAVVGLQAPGLSSLRLRRKTKRPRRTPRRSLPSMTRTPTRRSSSPRPREGEAEDKRVLLMFGGDWCGWCHKLHELFAAVAEIRRLLSYEYELVMVGQGPPRPGTPRGVLEGKDHLGYPFLAVMDPGGKVLTGQETGSLEEGDHHDPKKVMEFLARWVVEPKDAQVVLREALARASSDDKKVFLSFGAPWCGWCHRLENYLARPEVASILDRDFVVLKVDTDRMTRGKDVMKRFRPDDSGGIPWFAFLDARGTKLATSDMLDGRKNIGYPFEPKEIDAFMSLIEGQVRRIEPGQAARVRKVLETAGAKVISDMKTCAAEAAAKREEVGPAEN